MVTKAILTVPPGVTDLFYQPGDHEIATWSLVKAEEFGRVLSNGSKLKLSFANESGATLTYDNYYDINLGTSDQFLEDFQDNTSFEGVTTQGEIGRLNNEITKWTTTEHVDHIPDENNSSNPYPSTVKQVTEEEHTVMLEIAKGNEIIVNVAAFNPAGLSDLVSFDTIDIYDRTDVILAIGDANLNGIWQKEDLETVAGYQSSSVSNLTSSDTISYTTKNERKNSHGFRLENNIYAKQNSLYNETSLHLGDNTIDPFNSADPSFWDNLNPEAQVNIYPPQGYLTKTEKSTRIKDYSKNNLGEIDKIYIDGYKYLPSPRLEERLQSVEFIEVGGVVEQIKISFEINGVQSTHTFPYQDTGVAPRTDKATGKKFYNIYSLLIDNKRKYLISQFSTNLYEISLEVNNFSPEELYHIGFNLSEEGSGLTSEWYIPFAYKAYKDDITEYIAEGDINIVSLDGKFAPVYKTQIGNYTQHLEIDYNEGVEITEITNECTFTVDSNNYVTAIHHSGSNFNSANSSGLSGGETSIGQFYKTYSSGTSIGDIAVEVKSVDGTYFAKTLTWNKPSGETALVFSQTAKGKNGINTLNSITLEYFNLIKEDINFSSTFFTASITKGLASDSAYIVSGGLEFDAPIGSRIENGHIGKINTESTTRIIEPFDEDLGYYPNKMDLSNIALSEWKYSDGVSGLLESQQAGSENLNIEISREYFSADANAMIIDPNFKQGLKHWETENNFGAIPFQTTLGNIRISTTPKNQGFKHEPVITAGDGTNMLSVIGEEDSEEGLIVARVGTWKSEYFYSNSLPVFDENSTFDYTSQLSKIGNLISNTHEENIDIQWDSSENTYTFSVLFPSEGSHYLMQENEGFVSSDQHESRYYTLPKNINHMHLSAGNTFKFKNTEHSIAFWLNDIASNGGTEIATTQEGDYVILDLPYQDYKDVEKIYYNIGNHWDELPVSIPVFNDYMPASVGLLYNQLNLISSRRKQKTNKVLYINDCFSLTDWTSYTSSAHDQFFIEKIAVAAGFSMELPPASEDAIYATWDDIKDSWIAGTMSDDIKWQILKHGALDPREYFAGVDSSAGNNFQDRYKSTSHWYNHFNQYDCVIWNARGLGETQSDPLIHENFIEGLLKYRKQGGGILFTSGDIGYSDFWRKNVAPHFGLTHESLGVNAEEKLYGSLFTPTNNNFETEGWISQRGFFPVSSILPDQPRGYFGAQLLENISENTFIGIDQFNPSIVPSNDALGNNEGGIYQNIATTPNEVYDVEFEIRNAIGGSTAVYIDNVLQAEKFTKGDFNFTHSFKAIKDITKLEVKSKGEDYVYREIKSIKSNAVSKDVGRHTLIPQENANRLTNSCSVLNKLLFDKYYLSKEGLNKHIINSELGTSLEVIQLNPEGTHIDGVEIPHIDKISIFERTGDPLPSKYSYESNSKTLSLYVRPEDCAEASNSIDELQYDLRYVASLIQDWFTSATGMSILDHIDFLYKKAEYSEKDTNILNNNYADIYQSLGSPYFANTGLITGSIRILGHNLNPNNTYGFNTTRINSYYHRLSKYDIWLPISNEDFEKINDADELPSSYPNDLFGDTFQSTDASFYWPSLILNKCLGDLSWQTASTYQGTPGDSIFAWELYSSGHLGFKATESDHFNCLKNPSSCGFEDAANPSLELNGSLVSDGQEVFCTKSEWTTITANWASFNNFKDRYPTFVQDAYLVKYFSHYHPLNNWSDEYKNIDFIKSDNKVEVVYSYNGNFHIVNEPIPFQENIEKVAVNNYEEILCSTSPEGITKFTKSGGQDFIRSSSIDASLKTVYHTDDRSYVIQDRITPSNRLGILKKGWQSPKYFPEQSLSPVVVDKSKYLYFQLFSDDVTQFNKVKFALIYADENTGKEENFGIYEFPKPIDAGNNFSCAFFNAYGITSETLRRVSRILHHNKKYYPKLTENGSLPDYSNNRISERIDSDGDGVPNINDAFPNDSTESADSDSDGVGDNADYAPNDSNVQNPPPSDPIISSPSGVELYVGAKFLAEGWEPWIITSKSDADTYEIKSQGVARVVLSGGVDTYEHTMVFSGVNYTMVDYPHPQDIHKRTTTGHWWVHDGETDNHPNRTSHHDGLNHINLRLQSRNLTDGRRGGYFQYVPQNDEDLNAYYDAKIINPVDLTE
jgi:hypothetical protein